MQDHTTYAPKDSFLENLLFLYKSVLHDEDPLKNLRVKAFEHFLELGPPEKKQEAFQYIPLKHLYSQKWHLNDQKVVLSKEEVIEQVLPECQRSYIVLVNGVLRLDLSDISALPRSVTVQTLDGSIRTYGAFLQNRFSKMLKEERDPFVVLNAALQSGFFIMIPPKVKIEAPLQCLEFYTEAEMPRAFFPRLHLTVAAGSEVSFISTASRQKEKDLLYWSNSVVDIAIEEGAKCHFINAKQHAQKAIAFDAVRISLKKESELSCFSLGSGALINREGYHFTLLGERARAILKSLSMLQNSRQMHIHVLMEHVSPHCESMQHIKSVLTNSSKFSFEGKIFVHKEAQKTAAYQLNNNLLLDEYALAYSKPNLEIMADDVKASHGATFSQINPEELFYLRTRGINERTAKKLWIQGFCKEIANTIFLDSLRIEALQKIEQMVEDQDASSTISL